MNEETKRHILIGGGLAVAVVLGLYAFKKYQSGAQTSNAQTQADQLAYLEMMAGAGTYGYAGGGGGYVAPAVSPSNTTQSLASEVLGIEQAFGFAPTTGTGSSGKSSTTSTVTSGSSGGITQVKTAPLTVAPKLSAVSNYTLAGTPEPASNILEKLHLAEGVTIE